MHYTKEIKVGGVKFGGLNPFALVAGPCVIESEDSCMRHAEAIRKITDQAGIPFIFKASYDKANRSSGASYRGPGFMRGIKMLQKIKKTFQVPVLSDVHSAVEAREAGGYLDIIQIPAFLCRQTDILIAAARTEKCVNIKKGQFLAPWDIKNIIQKVESQGNRRIIVTERGTSFGYNNLVSDFRSIIIMKEFGYPICYDATHSVQIPGGLGDKSGGDRKYVPMLAKAAICCGADILFLEVHENPAKALSDGPNMIRLKNLKSLLTELKGIEKASSGKRP